MGIRVYIRNTADVNSEHEICLGKLYAYAVGNENFESVNYMIEHHCFCAEYMEYFYEYHDNYDILSEHVDCLACANYLEYGEFSYFHDTEIFEFITLFANDFVTLWFDEYPNVTYDAERICERIKETNKKYNNTIWEIRQGA